MLVPLGLGKVGAAVLGVPVKPTIKEVDAEGNVVKTLQRAALWEVQTPQVLQWSECLCSTCISAAWEPGATVVLPWPGQVIRPDLLREGFEAVRREGLEVTDDVSIIEALGLPVRVTKGSYTNIKVTTPEDLSVAERFLSEVGATLLAAAA